MEVEVVEVEVEVGWAEMMSPPQEAMRYRYRFFIVTRHNKQNHRHDRSIKDIRCGTFPSECVFRIPIQIKSILIGHQFR